MPPLTSPTKTPTKPTASYLPVVNSAPEPVDLSRNVKPVVPEPFQRQENDESEPKRKKYAKESWPGRKQQAASIAPLLF
ncbi:nuclear inhibitor of protein phosphatase 1-like [Bolinopsis microptera]